MGGRYDERMSSPGDDDGASPRAFSPACRRKGELITTVIVWLLLGAIVNVAVAWTSAGIRDSVTCLGGHGIVGYASDGYDAWLVAICPRSTATGVAFELIEYKQRPDLPIVRELIPIWSGAQYPPSAVQVAEKRIIPSKSNVAIAHGWPAMALQWSCTITLPNPVHAGSIVSAHNGIEWRRSSIPTSHPLEGLHVLPLRPIWPGFTLNTLFYAAILWLLFAAPFALR